MKVALLCQEEPVFLSPFLIQVMSQRPQSVVAVFIAGNRGAGEPTRTLQDRIRSLWAFWLMMEPVGFLAGMLLRLRGRCWGESDSRSVAGAARRLGIPVHPVQDPNGVEFHAALRGVSPDLVLNQSEKLLRKETLSIPKRGFINRHASLLPAHRGRLGSFWSHASEPPTYGVTFHLVDEGIDTGPIVLQQAFQDVDPRWSYPKVMQHLCAKSPALFWEAVDRLEAGVPSQPMPSSNEPQHRFPTLDEVRAYCRLLASRRSA